MKDNLQTTLVHGGLLCGRPEGDPCADEDLPLFRNPITQEDEPNPYIDFMQVSTFLSFFSNWSLGLRIGWFD